jgi:uncharacterized membrane protein
MRIEGFPHSLPSTGIHSKSSKNLLDNSASPGFSLSNPVPRPCKPGFQLPSLDPVVLERGVPDKALNFKGAVMSVEASQSGLSENAASGLAYVTIIPAIIFLIVAPFNQNRVVRFHSWQSIFLAIAWIVVDVALAVMGRLPFIGWTTWFLMPLVGLAFLILWIIVLINAFNGKRFKVPIVGDLAEKQADS